MRFDHLLHWVPDRAAAVAEYQGAGFHVVIGGEHPGWGSHNALCHLGLSYIELIGIYDPVLARTGPDMAFAEAGRVLGQGGGVPVFAVAVPDMETAVFDLRGRGISVGEPIAGQRARPDGTVVRWKMAPLLSGPRWRPFLIDWQQSDRDRLTDLQRRGIDAPHPGGQHSLQSMTVISGQPESDATWVGLLTDRPVTQSEDGWRVPLPGCEILVTSPQALGCDQGRAPLVAAVSLLGEAAHRLELYGLGIRVLTDSL